MYDGRPARCGNCNVVMGGGLGQKGWEEGRAEEEEEKASRRDTEKRRGGREQDTGARKQKRRGEEGRSSLKR